MMANAFLKGLVIISGLALPSVGGSAQSSRDSLEAVEIQRQQQKMMLDQQRRARNLADFQLLKQVDSVGWIKVKALRSPSHSLEELEREQVMRKMAALFNFCIEARFDKQSEVDSLPGISVEERDFCKGRLRTINPLIP